MTVVEHPEWAKIIQPLIRTGAKGRGFFLNTTEPTLRDRLDGVYANCPFCRATFKVLNYSDGRMSVRVSCGLNECKTAPATRRVTDFIRAAIKERESRQSGLNFEAPIQRNRITFELTNAEVSRFEHLRKRANSERRLRPLSRAAFAAYLVMSAMEDNR